MPIAPQTAPAALPPLAVLRDCFVAGPPRGADANDRIWRGCGIFDAEGFRAAEAEGWMGRPKRLPAGRRARAGALEAALFCGRYRGHFGHLLAEGVGRIWAAGTMGPDLPLLWFAHPKEASGKQKLLQTFLTMLSIPNPVMVTSKAIRVGGLHVPPTLLDPLFGVPAAPAFQDWLAPRLPLPEAGAPDLYVSRMRLDDRAGRFLGEAALEEGLVAEGYVVIHPETLPLSRQIALYRGARRIVAAEGSALHLLALLDVPGQEIAVVMRRPRLVGSLPATFASFRRGRVHVVDHVRRAWNLTPNMRAIFRAVSELDIGAVWNELVARGFVGPGARPVPSPAEIEAERLQRAADRQVLLP